MSALSVIVTTHESPQWLEKVLWGYSVQTFKDFEIVVADDGSSPLTAGLIEQMRFQTELHIQHVWQEHQGFRKCRILNRAILAANAPYLIFTDGDCIPRNDFCAIHHQFAQRGCFLSGGILRLNRSLSHMCSREDILSGDLFRIRTLLSRGQAWDRKLRFLARNPLQIRVFEAISTTRATFNGYNSSAWRDDIIAVNGFDQRMQYGGLDRELGERLTNYGVCGRSIRHRSVCLHLDHARGYKNAEGLRRNIEIRIETRQLQRRWTDSGIRLASDPSILEGIGQCAESSVL